MVDHPGLAGLPENGASLRAAVLALLAERDRQRQRAAEQSCRAEEQSRRAEEEKLRAENFRGKILRLQLELERYKRIPGFRGFRIPGQDSGDSGTAWWSAPQK